VKLLDVDKMQLLAGLYVSADELVTSKVGKD
jgi:hypothetical protein